MSEELQESDVVFSDHFIMNSDDDSLLVFPEVRPKSRNNANNMESRKSTMKTKTTTTMAKKSSPVPVPASFLRRTDYDSFDGGGEITPPHVIIERRLQGKTAFSVCTGNGRTLKGRDLSRVRNSVLRLTGFLEI